MKTGLEMLKRTKWLDIARRINKIFPRKDRKKSVVKNPELIAYYVMVLAFIYLGFFVGSKEEIQAHGYPYYESNAENASGMNGETPDRQKSKYLGDFTKIKVVDWYVMPLKISYKCLVGADAKNPIMELDYDFIRKNFPDITGEPFLKGGSDEVHYVNMIAFAFVCATLLGFPLGLPWIAKSNKNRDSIGSKKLIPDSKPILDCPQ